MPFCETAPSRSRLGIGNSVIYRAATARERFFLGAARHSRGRDGPLNWKYMRLRTAHDRLKVEHSIIDGVREVLERLLAENPGVRSVIPGVIRPVRDARGKIKFRITVPTQNGWKAIALSAGARQELFISTDMPREELVRALERAGAELA